MFPHILHVSTLPLLLLPLPFAAVVNAAVEVVIPCTSFDSSASFQQFWGNCYPWSCTHNGAARMHAENVAIADGALELKAVRNTSEPDIVHPGKPTLVINYSSGTVHALKQIHLPPGGALSLTFQTIAPSVKGAWPALWLTGAKGWPPEIDVIELKGAGTVWFNTYNSSSAHQSKIVPWPKPDEWHTIKFMLRDLDGVNAESFLWIDDAPTPIDRQVGAGYTGQSFWLLIDLQMEGASGSPGPDADTLFKIRDLKLISYNKDDPPQCAVSLPTGDC